MKLVALFFEFFKISLFVIGGGYAIIAVADESFAKRGWIKEGELLDHLPIFQMLPGLIATHSAVYVGRKVAGPIGAAVAVIAVALPAISVFLAISMLYSRLPLNHPCLGAAFIGLRAALTGIIAATIIRSWRRNLKDGFAYGVMAIAVFLIAVLSVNVALVLVAAALVGIGWERWAIFGERPPRTRLHCAGWLPFLIFLKYGLLAFGGGFVIVPMYMEDFVGATAPYLQITVEEFSNVMALSQMTPGPIGVNAVTFFGYRLFGVPGSLLASALLLLPGSILVYLTLGSLERFNTSRIVIGLMRGIRPASIALMLVALAAFARFACTSWLGVVLVAADTYLAYTKRIGVIALILGTAMVSLAVMALEKIF